MCVQPIQLCCKICMMRCEHFHPHQESTVSLCPQSGITTNLPNGHPCLLEPQKEGRPCNITFRIPPSICCRTLRQEQSLMLIVTQRMNSQPRFP